MHRSDGASLEKWFKSSKATINWQGEQARQLLALAMVQQALLCFACTVAVLS